jgi:V-type H+-transporting ATPase subunit d
MDCFHYNIQYGFLDAIVRARFQDFLSDAQYLQLKQCQTNEDVKLQLSNFHFDEYFKNEVGQTTPSLIYEKCLQRMVSLVSEVDRQSTGNLREFMKYILIPYMIDNVVLLISGVIHHRDISELIEHCHPLGLFEGITSLSICERAEDLYNAVLVDTPLAPLFLKCLNKNTLTEQNIEIIQLTLYLDYFHAFYEFCEQLGNLTFDVMRDNLILEANHRSVIINNNFNEHHFNG